jgi:hypothetical protein
MILCPFSLFQKSLKRIKIDRLGIRHIGPAHFSVVLWSLEPQPRQCDNPHVRHLCLVSLYLFHTPPRTADRSAGLKAIHDGHTDVHESSGEARGGSLEFLKGFEAVDGGHGGVAELLSWTGE